MEKKLSHWLILSHAFNMDGRASSLTVTDKIPYLLDFGISLTAISAVTGKKDERFPHYQLFPWGPSGFRFDFRHYIATRYGRGLLYRFITPFVSIALLPLTVLERLLFGLSSQSSWALPAFLYGWWQIKYRNVNLIYSSGGAWSAHLAGYWLKKATGVQWIAEIHDPMVMRFDANDSGAGPRKNREDSFFQKLEIYICQHADHVWWFTEGALEYAIKRNPQLGQKGFVVYPGANPPDIDLIKLVSHSYGDFLNLGHFGSLADNRSLKPLFEALARFFLFNPDAQAIIRINVFGSSLDNSSKRAMDNLGLRNNVVEYGRIEKDSVTGLSGRIRVAEYMRQQDALLLMHGDYEACSEYIPSKMYDYFWSGRPVFAITHKNVDLDNLLLSRSAYVCKTFNQESILRELNRLWSDWKSKNLPSQKIPPITPKDAVLKILSRIK